jgi:hypothetical protein
VGGAFWDKAGDDEGGQREKILKIRKKRGCRRKPEMVGRREKEALVEENMKITGCIDKLITCLFSRQLLCWNLVEVSLNSRDGLLKLF